MSDETILDAFRRWGYLQAQLDPLGRLKPQPHPELDVTGQAADRGRTVYCGSIGVEFMHMPYPDRCRWIQKRMESDAPEPDRTRVLDRLVSADTFERVLQSRYVGTKRYSLEGATALIPLLDAVLEGSAEHGGRGAGGGHESPRSAERDGPHRGQTPCRYLRRVRGS